MTGVNGVSINKLSADRASEAGNLLAASHADYPVFRHLLPNPAVRKRVLRRFMGAAARDAAIHAHALMALVDGSVVGVALWMSPGTFPLSAARKARMAPAMLGASAMAPRAMAVLGRAGSDLENAHEPGPGWYLQALGVYPELQRRGIGRQLLTPPLRLADAQGLPCYLHTSDPNNIAYYERFGFRTAEGAGVVVSDAVRYYGMTREPGEAVAEDGSLPQE